MAKALTDTRARSSSDTAAMRAAMIGLFALLAGISAQIQFPMPPLGVPQTLQTLVVILAALHLGPRWGVLSMLIYVLVGAIGAPVFSKGGAGLAVILGQSGGYILGFILSQPVIARCVRRSDGSPRGWGAIVLASLAGHAVVFAIGVPWLYVVRTIGTDSALEALTWKDAIYGGFIVFIPATLLKTIIAVLIARASLPWAMRKIW